MLIYICIEKIIYEVYTFSNIMGEVEVGVTFVPKLS